MRDQPVVDGEMAARGILALGRRRRPTPPTVVQTAIFDTFAADPAFVDWIRATFVDDTGPLANEEHAHLADAAIGVLWTNAANRSKMRRVMATAEIPNAMGGGWKRARYEYQLREWFGTVPDFLLTFSAPDCRSLDDRTFCALVEHELYHCAQQVDEFGAPRFSKASGRPVFGIRGHDVEEFTGVVRRYGAVSRDVRDLVDAASAVPLIAGQPIELACGTRP